MRLLATGLGGGILALLGVYLMKVLLGGAVSVGLFLLGFFFKLLLAVLAVWLGIKLLKKLVPPAKEA